MSFIRFALPKPERCGRADRFCTGPAAASFHLLSSLSLSLSLSLDAPPPLLLLAGATDAGGAGVVSSNFHTNRAPSVLMVNSKMSGTRRNTQGGHAQTCYDTRVFRAYHCRGYRSHP